MLSKIYFLEKYFSKKIFFKILKIYEENRSAYFISKNFMKWTSLYHPYRYSDLDVELIISKISSHGTPGRAVSSTGYAIAAAKGLSMPFSDAFPRCWVTQKLSRNCRVFYHIFPALFPDTEFPWNFREFVEFIPPFHPENTLNVLGDFPEIPFPRNTLGFSGCPIFRWTYGQQAYIIHTAGYGA